MGRWAGVLAGWLVAAGAADAQPAPADLPPLGLPGALDPAGLPNGAAVSRPLEPVVEPGRPDPLASPTISILPGVGEQYEDVSPLGRSWGAYEYLLWWPSASPRPNPLGGGDFTAPATSGGRFTLGSALDPTETVGWEVTYLFTGTQTVGEFADLRGVGSVDTSLSNRMTGWEITGVANLLARPDLRVNALAGYRYFLINEGLRLERLVSGVGSAVATADQFDAHNRFHGGQFGLHTDWMRGPVFVELAGKLGVGQATTVARTSGQTVAASPGFPFPVVRVSTNGLLARPGWPTRRTSSGFAVLPEATVKFGYRFRDRSRAYLGYNFLYLSEGLRPGGLVGPCGCHAPTPGSPTNSPLVPSDFWVQGLLFGLEYRY